MRILLVEDEEKVSGFIARGLPAERFAVDTAKDGQTGLQDSEVSQRWGCRVENPHPG